MVPAQGDPAAPQGCGTEQGARPGVTPPAGCPRFPGDGGQSTPPAEGETYPHGPSPLLIPLRHAERKPHHLETAPTPPPAAPPARGAPQNVTSARPSSPQRPSSQGELPPRPFSPASSQFFFFRKQLTLFFEEQQMSETLPAPFMMLNLLPGSTIAILMTNAPTALTRLSAGIENRSRGGHAVSGLLEENEFQPFS